MTEPMASPAQEYQRLLVRLAGDGRGPESLDLTYRMLAGHGQFHMDQMRKTLAAVKPGAMAEAPGAGANTR